MAKKLTEREVEEMVQSYVSRLKKKISIDKAVLFGSYAKGTAHEWSDIDLLIVSDELSETVPKGKNGFYLNRLIDDFNPYLEVIGVNPSTLNKPINKSFFDEILDTGKFIQ